jgi:hypothetical protein
MDLLESFTTIKAGHRETWTFLTQVDRLEMWTSPYADLVFAAESRELDVGSEFDIVLRLPGRPVLRCVVLSLDDEALQVKLDGFISGLATWRVVPAGEGVIVHGQLRYRLTDRRWTVLWTLAGRWVGAVSLGWLMRLLKARVEDTVGSSRFGVPLLVSPYAVALGVAAISVLVGVVVRRVKRRLYTAGGPR